MRPKKYKKQGKGSGLTKSPPLTPSKGVGRRGRPPKSPTNAPHPSSSLASQENHKHSVSPDHSRTSSSDQDAYQGHPASGFNSKSVQHLDTAELSTNSTLLHNYISPNDAIDRPRKLAKRERKALIKSSRRPRAVIDESFVANMNELSELFQSKCGVGPFEIHPVPMAADPSKTLLSNACSRGGKNRGGSRRGKPPLSSSVPKPAFASFTPLCLPFGGLPDRLKSPTTQLKQLTPRCVRRFLKAANGILEPSSTVSRLFQPMDFPSSTVLPPPPSFLPPTTPAITGEMNGICCNNDNVSNHTILSSPGKRGRGRPPKLLVPTLDSTTNSSVLLGPLTTTTEVLTAQPVMSTKTPVKSRRNSAGTPRELRALLTWDAMMKASQESSGSFGPGGDSVATTGAASSSIDPTSPLSLQIVPSGNDEFSDQRTTRGRSRRLSTGMASSGSLAESDFIQQHQPNSVALGLDVPGVSSSPLGSEVHLSNFVEGGTSTASEPHHHTLSPSHVVTKNRNNGGRKRRAASPSFPTPSSTTPPPTTNTIPTLEQDGSQASAALASPLLPPRKRYKVVGSGGGSGEMVSSTTTACPADSFSHHPRTDNSDDEDDDFEFDTEEIDDGNTSEPVSLHINPHQQRAGSASPTDGVVIVMGAATPNGKRRSRGRPSKRTYSPNGRPKREAAAMGFATMVASSINATSMLSMIEETQPPSSHPASDVADVAKDDEDVSSKRGRKSRKGTSSALAGAAPKPRGRPPKNPRPIEEPFFSVELEDKKPTLTAPDIFIEIKPPVVSPKMQDVLEEKSIKDLEVSKAGGLKKAKRGKRPTPCDFSLPSTKSEEVQESEESRLFYGSHQLRLFLLRNHSSRRKAKANVLESVPMGLTTTQQLLTAGPIEELPSRTAFFPFSSLSLSIFEDSESKASEVQDEHKWVRQLYYRLLSTPDLCDSSTRLTAPLLSLPCPLRHPEFYRFVCASGLLNNFEGALECENSIQPRVLGTVSPEIVSEPLVKTAPFYPSNSEWPPLCLRHIIPRLATTVKGFQQLDLLLEFLFRTWEAYAGRRSWLGKQLQQIRSLYNQLRTEHVATHPEKQLPLLSAGLASGSVKGSGPIIAGSGAARKKVDRQTLERGAEVIRCLCGFRVEGGHVMVQCNACVTRQHLPCVWWALCLDMNPRLAAPATLLGSTWPSTMKPCASSARSARCRAALLGALAAGGHDILSFISSHIKSVDSCPVYYCPNCLELDGLTKDYPRTLAASLEVHDVSAVFSKSGERREYWSLGTEEEQFLTDEFAIIHRNDYRDATATGTSTNWDAESSCRPPITKTSDAVVVRIYQLWKDANGISWMEGGAFLRPYDLPSNLSTPETLWHSRELIYDETSRLILPLSLLRGRCCVLSPTTYRLGRPADLPAVVLNQDETVNSANENHPLVFLCERLMTRNDEGELIIKDIAPAYLKVITKPYYFLRHPETSPLRATITRTFSTQDLVHLDTETRFGAIISCGVEPGRLFSESVRHRWVDEPIGEAVQQDVSNISNSPTHLSTPSSKRPRERSLNSVLPLLKPRPLTEATSAVANVFHHGPRKPSIVRPFLPKSHLLSSPSSSSSSSKKRSRLVGATAPAAAIKQLSFAELKQQIALGDDSLTKDSLTLTSRRRGRKPKAATPLTTNTLFSVEPMRVDVDMEVMGEEEGREDCWQSSISPKLADVTSVADFSFPFESIAVTGVLQQVAPMADDESMPATDEVQVQPLQVSVSSLQAEEAPSHLEIGRLHDYCLQYEDTKEDISLECSVQLVRNRLEAEIVEETPCVNSNDLLHTSPPPSLLANSYRVPCVLFDEYESSEEEHAGDLPAVEYLDSAVFLSIVSRNEEKGEAFSLRPLSPPAVLEASTIHIVHQLPVGREDEVDNEVEEQEVDEEEACRPIVTSTSESTSDASNDNTLSSASSKNLTAVTVSSLPAAVTVEENSTPLECHHSTLSTSSVTPVSAVTTSTFGSSSRRRKGSSPKKRIFDDPERILDLSAKSSGVDE